MRVLGGRYELAQPVGHGGMGVVWRGVDRELGRTVAVKVLPAELTRQQEFRDRFRREARTVAALSHPGVATLYDVGEDTTDGEPTPFLVMEFVDGRTLAEALHEGPLPIGRTVAIARDVADALVHSHGHGVVHRDLKPANIMLTSSGRVKVLDFGIAKVLAETTTRLTATGMTVGTPAYLSPEQIEGRDVDARTDLYSLGALIYELLAGRPPFLADSPFAVMHQHLSKPPTPPSAMRPQVPEDLDALVLRLLAKHPDDRFPTASRLLAALEDVRARSASGTPAADTTRNPNVARPTSRATEPTTEPTPTPVTAGDRTPAPPPPVPPAPGPPRMPGIPPSVGSAPQRSGGGPWAIRFRLTGDGLLAVAGGALLAATWLSVRPDGFKGFNQLCPAVAVLAAAALLWSARLAVLLVWGPLAVLAAALFSAPYRRAYRRQTFTAYGATDHWNASDLTSEEFAGIASFALLALIFLVAFLRRRDTPGLYIAAFWLFAALTGWSCSSMGDENMMIALWIVLGVLAAVELAREIRGRRVPASAPRLPRHPMQPG
ncbi:protein kinase [Embleya sp. NPDC050493]|uniref:protein kinase domain-containing protein n=1 Tax=Embleya sp. NPDC050493 TaxID=3363989 RepID=UPI00378FE8E7